MTNKRENYYKFLKLYLIRPKGHEQIISACTRNVIESLMNIEKNLTRQQGVELYKLLHPQEFFEIENHEKFAH